MCGLQVTPVLSEEKEATEAVAEDGGTVPQQHPKQACVSSDAFTDLQVPPRHLCILQKFQNVGSTHLSVDSVSAGQSQPSV